MTPALAETMVVSFTIGLVVGFAAVMFLYYMWKDIEK